MHIKKSEVYPMNTKTQKIVISAMLCALCCVATMLIKIPSPLHGYINLGDCTVLLCGWLLPPFYGALAAGTGSMLADIFSGYIIYAPATFIIKALMATVACFLFKAMRKKTSTLPARLTSGAVSEILMILGYLIFEGFMYGFVPSLVNVLPNAVQGAFGLAIGVILIRLFEKNKIFVQ